MSCGAETLTIPVGYAFPLTIAIDDEGVVQDLSGWAFEFTARDSGGVVVASADAVVAGTEATLTVPDTLAVGSYAWAIKATPPAGEPYPLVDNARLIISPTTTEVV